MLHELLLCLSGHPSPIIANGKDSPFHSLLSPPEHALLKTLSTDLGDKHLYIREEATSISKTHPSIVCRAVAAAVISVHLEDFQQRILEVEKDILQDDPKYVGAYNVVPLSAMVTAFDGWRRKLSWLKDLVDFIKQPGASERQRDPGFGKEEACSAAETIQWARDASHTGYPEIAQMALQVVGVAEMAWLKQVASWVLYGKHPGGADFFVTRKDGEQDSRNSAYSSYIVVSKLVPCFVTPSTASSILFLGKSLNHIRDRQASAIESSYNIASPETSLLPAHLKHLSALKPPISSAAFSKAIGAIRLSLSENALQRLLPLSEVLDVLQLAKDFLLLGRGEFAIALITAADGRLSSRQGRDATNAKKHLHDLASLTIRDGEVHSVLARTWTTLASMQSMEDDSMNEALDRARELITLTIKTVDSRSSERDQSSGVSFDDLLLPSSTLLSLRIMSPLDLFLGPSDVTLYSNIHAYLLAIRRAHLHLSRLSQLSTLRRVHPSPAKANRNANHRHQEGSAQRTNSLRSIWATVSAAAFFFSELADYFQGEVVQSSWSTFHTWLLPPFSPVEQQNQAEHISAADSLSASSRGSHSHSQPASSRQTNKAIDRASRLHDPETLAKAHRAYLESIRHSILLNDLEFTSMLRRQMTAVDHLCALLQRLDTVVSNSQASGEEVFVAEEGRIMTDLRASKGKVAEGIKRLVERLRRIDDTRDSGAGGVSRDLAAIGDGEMDGSDSFVPWASGGGRGLERVLLKLDYGGERDERFMPDYT
ncbi:MAG: hypothetical protein OHK93_005458 [Ramalina farinacea]|uniref:Spindle pole body component n=1 Tax=Ramalina farinacea TaxID=258253 RepID=A0AA43QIB3_9LECA|nr:hypothetical protein [Ramalina farinacea]